MPGYAPFISAPGMIDVAVDAAKEILPDIKVTVSYSFETGSTDMGDLSCIMPTVHPYAAGVTGIGHGANYQVSDPDTACVKNAAWQIAMLQLLLRDGAVRAKQILSDFTPLFASKEEYLTYVDALSCAGDRIEYREDGTVITKIE